MSLPTALTDVLDGALEFIYSLQPYVEPTVVLVPSALQTQVQGLADSIGFDVEVLNYTLAMFLCYPLGIMMNMLPYGQVRHLFSFVFGAFLLQFTLGVQWIHQFITSIVVYLMLLMLPRKFNTLAVPVFVMGYCVLGHLHRQYVNYLGWDLDFTGAQMVITQKLYMIAFNLYDAELLAKGSDNRAAKKCAKYSLKDLPNLLEFLGYTFSFSSILAGPAYEFAVYKQTCDGSLLYKADGTPKGKIPSNVWPTLRPLLQSLFYLGIFVAVGSQVPLLDTADPQKNTPVVLTEEFLSKPWFYRYAYTWLGLFVAVRTKYYFGWKNAEGANNIWYAGFEGFDGDGKALGWGNSDNMDVWKFETAPNFQTLSKEWNKKTSIWLQRYVYFRTNGSLIAVYGTSAFWHGFYPGYYLFFLSVPLFTMCERLGKKKISPYFSKEKWSPYGVASILITSFLIEGTVTAFVMLSYERTVGVWQSNYFLSHVLGVVFFIILSALPSPPKKKKEE